MTSPWDSVTDLRHQSGAPVLEAEVLRTLEDMGGDAAFVFELVDLFLDDARTRVPELLSAAESGQPEALSKSAHALRSASANIGAQSFAALCGRIEAACREGDADLATLGSEAAVMFDEVARALAGLKEGA